MDKLLLLAVFLCPLLLALAAGAFISDFLLPRCPRLLHFLERLLHVDMGGNGCE